MSVYCNNCNKSIKYRDALILESGTCTGHVEEDGEPYIDSLDKSQERLIFCSGECLAKYYKSLFNI